MAQSGVITPKDWLKEQPGNVQSYEKVSHAYLSEETGEMYCAICGATENTKQNRRRALIVFMLQEQVFERFTAKHLHGIAVRS